LRLIPHNDTQNSRSAISPMWGYEHAVRLRQMALAADLPLPHYLLAPEVAVLLSYLPDMRQRLLIDTLWNTGARINEALALTPNDFFFNDVMPFVRLRTLKQRTTKKPVGRPTKEASHVVPLRAVPLPDLAYQRRVQEYFSTFKLMARRASPIWDISSTETPRNWLKAAVGRAKRDGVTFSITPIVPKTFRHSFAVHLLMNGVHIKKVQALMGHERLESTEVYTKIFALDVTRDLGLSFSMLPEEALLLLKSNA
jgi:integrase